MKYSHQDIFSKTFLDIPISTILSSVEEKGYFSFSQALCPEFLGKLYKELKSRNSGVNINDVCPVLYHQQLFYVHALAGSETFFNLLTNEFVLDLCEKNFSSEFRLKCQRYYENGYGYKMSWHTDTKTTENVKTNVKGLIFIIYIEDTFDGEFQLISGSHKHSQEKEYTEYSDTEIENFHEDSIVSFKMPGGSLVVYDTNCIHRAKPIEDKDFVRKSIFFQVDEDLLHGEKVLLNSEFLKCMNPRLEKYLGFGLPTIYVTQPQTSLDTMTDDQLSVVLKSCLQRIGSKKRFIKITVFAIKKLLRKLFT